MTAAVIKCPKQVIGRGEGVMARRKRREATASAASNTDADYGKQRRLYNPYSPPNDESTDSSGNNDE